MQKQAKKRTYKPMEDKIREAILDMLANPTYDCNPAGSYDLEPVFEVIRQERQKELEELLKNGHGGGNWRRLINLQLAKFTTPKEGEGK